jgi:hypothetical protein
MLTIYQRTELIIGTILFILFYFLVLYFSNRENLSYYDVIVTTIAFFLIMYIRYFFINYYIFQSQNFSSNNIVNE